MCVGGFSFCLRGTIRKMERMKIADKDKEGKDEDYDELAMEQHQLWQEKA